MSTSEAPQTGWGTSRNTIPGPAVSFTSARMNPRGRVGRKYSRATWRRWSEDRAMQTAVDAERGAGDVGGELGREKRGNGAELLGSADAAGRDRRRALRHR